MVHLENRHVGEGIVAVLRIDNPPVNSVGSQVRVSLGEHLDKVLTDATIQAVVLTGTGRFFSGGADIREFNTPKTQVRPLLRELIARIEAADKPIVAAINGMALGGGLELALGCHGRVASESAKLGLPEVKLGILPGAGGTQRLPRIIGIAAALDIIVDGEPVTAQQALSTGLVDAVAADPIDAACELALAIARGERQSRAVDPAPLHNAVPAAVFDEARRNAQRRYRGCLAPQECIACIEQTLHTDLEAGLAFEADRFKFLVEGDQSKAQRHLFFAERQATKLPGAAEPALLSRVGVVGAGTMGGGIAMSLANAGYHVVLLEQTEAALHRGWETIQRNYAASCKRGRFTEQEVKARLARIQCSLDYADLADVDLVIEAAFEDMQVKKDIFTRLDAVCKPAAILASNTSRLDVNEIAEVTGRPGQVLGMHFFSPANVMRLLEVVKGEKTSDEVIATVFRLAVRLNKIPVLVGVCDGFVGNRMVSHYTREAYFLLEEGCTPAQVDGALRRFGMAMGPLQMQDMAGLDISWAARKRQAPTRPAHLRYSKVADRICEMGRFGQKTGSGFYRYGAGSREPIPDPEIDALIAQCAVEAGIERREISDEEIVARTIYALVNEGARIVQDGIAQRPSDIDVVYVAGYGFPMYRGGPMFYADTVGLPNVLETIRRFHAQHGPYWEPAPLLVELAESGQRFSGR
jgi:3-hydroxyacyl-CoA dehydrogenase